jgi:hypothetical protein
MRIDKHVRILLGCLLVAACGVTRAMDIQVVPPNPGYFEPVHLRVHIPAEMFYNDYVRDAQVSMSGTKIVVNLQTFQELRGDNITDIFLGRLPAGSYTVEVATSRSSPIAIPFAVTSRPSSDNTHVADVNGLWWAPDEPGWGVSIAHGPQTDLVATWFTQGPDRQPEWYSLQVSPMGKSFVSGPLFKVDAPYFGSPFTPPANARQVGTASVGVHGDRIQFSATIDGVTKSKELVRMKLE